MCSQSNESRRKEIHSSHVRFDSREFTEIQRDAELSGETIPGLLKKAYFNGRKVELLMTQEERVAWFRELRACGNNLNQIARRVNSGLFDGWYTEFKEVERRINAIESMVSAVYGRAHL